MKDQQNVPLTAFEDTEREMRRRFGNVSFNVESFGQPLKRCELSECKATCCHDGAYLGEEEADVISALVEEQREFFEELGVELPEDFLIPVNWFSRHASPRTATRPYPHSKKTKEYPAHFPDTQCVFLTGDHRCALQVLSTLQGKHP